MVARSQTFGSAVGQTRAGVKERRRLFSPSTVGTHWGSVNHPCLLDELERVQHLFQTVMDYLKVEVLHRPRISICRIGEGDSDIQFVTLVPVKAAIDEAIDQVANRDSVRLYNCEGHSVHGFIARTSKVRGGSSTFTHSACAVAAFRSLTENDAA
jgi:hypothetical protein